MALSDPHSAVVTVELTTRGGTVYRWCHSGQCPSGIVYEDGSTPRYFEPRLVGGVVTEDCGGLLGGFSRPRSGSVSVTLGHRTQTGYDDFLVGQGLLAGVGWPQLAGATVVVYVADRPSGGASQATSVRDRLATGKVPDDTDYAVTVRGGVGTIQVQWYVVDDALVIPQTRFDDGDDEQAAGVASLLAPLPLGATLGGGVAEDSVMWLETSGTPAAKRFRVASAPPGLVPSMNAPTDVSIGGTILTAQSPITDPPDAQGKWGSWSSTACTFVVNDTTGALNIGSGSGQVSRAWGHTYAYNVVGSGSPPTTNAQAFAQLMAAGSFSASQYDIDLTGTVTGLYLFGRLPYPPRDGKLLFADAFAEAVTRLLCVATTDASGKIRVRAPAAKTGPDHVFYRDAILSVDCDSNPFGEYANSVTSRLWVEELLGVDLEHFQIDRSYAYSVAGMLVATRDVTSLWWETQVDPGGSYAQRLATLLFQQAVYITANLGPQGILVRVGDCVALEWPTGLYDHLTSGAPGVLWHVRMRSIDLATLNVQLGIISAAWPGSTAGGGGWTFHSVPGGA